MKNPINKMGKNTNTDQRGLPVYIETTKLAINAEIKLKIIYMYNYLIKTSYHTIEKIASHLINKPKYDIIKANES